MRRPLNPPSAAMLSHSGLDAALNWMSGVQRLGPVLFIDGHLLIVRSDVFNRAKEMLSFGQRHCTHSTAQRPAYSDPYLQDTGSA